MCAGESAQTVFFARAMITRQLGEIFQPWLYMADAAFGVNAAHSRA